MRMSEGNVREYPIVEKEPNAVAARFFDLLKDFDEPLWDDCTNHIYSIPCVFGIAVAVVVVV